MAKNGRLGRPPISPEVIGAIKAAPLSESNERLALRVGVHLNTVRKYRREARGERQEAAAEIIAEHVQENVGDALDDLDALRRISREHYERDADPRQGALWLSAVKTTLEHVTPDAAGLDAEIAAELARVAGAGEEGDARTPQGDAYSLPGAGGRGPGGVGGAGEGRRLPV